MSYKLKNVVIFLNITNNIEIAGVAKKLFFLIGFAYRTIIVDLALQI